MRREHDSIFVDVLNALARYLDEKGPFHVTELSARANLPHDRLRTYLMELHTLGLIEGEATPKLTVKGRQFLECYHAWVRVQKLYGLDPRAGRGQPVRVLQTRRSAAEAAPSSLAPQVQVPAHDSFAPPEMEPRSVRGP